MIVTITAKEGRKIIEQFDVDLPWRAKYIAQDKDGWWCLYHHKPEARSRSWIGSWEPLKYVTVSPNPDWKDSLIKVSDIK